MKNETSYIIRNMYDFVQRRKEDKISIEGNGPIGILKKISFFNVFPLSTQLIFQIEVDSKVQDYIAYPSGIVTKQAAIKILREDGIIQK